MQEEITVTLQRKTVAVNGVNLNVIQAGPEDGELVILLHGFPEFWYGWREQIPALVLAAHGTLVEPPRPIDTGLAATESLRTAIAARLTPHFGVVANGWLNHTRGGRWTEPRDFNMMLKTYLGPVEDESGLHYLRPETAQGIFVNFAQVMTTSRKKPPFGIGQIGKSFRNEITPGNFIFRTREFEQMEMEFFVEPGTDAEWHQYWIDARTDWYVDLGLSRDNLRLYEHPQEKLSHYSTRTVDIEYRFGFQGSEWGELEGIANRTDFDLKTHSEHSGQDLSYFDQAKNERWVPYVIEPAAGLTRSLMAFLVEAYAEDEAPNAKGGVDKRTVLRLDHRLAPVKAAVLPLSRHEDLSPVARDLAAELPELEVYILALLADLDRKLKVAAEAYDFNLYTRLLVDFCNEDLSAFFFDIRKDSLYCDGPDSDTRNAYRTVLDLLFHALVRYAAPVLVFTAEEVWGTRFPDRGSVHLLEWSELPDWRDDALAERFAKLCTLRETVTEAIEPLRRDKVVRSSLEAGVTVPAAAVPDGVSDAALAELFITASVARCQGGEVTVTPTTDHKCGRCWRLLPEVVEDGTLCARCEDVVATMDELA